MAQGGDTTIRETALRAHPIAGSPAMFTVSGQIVLEAQDSAPFRVQIIGAGKDYTADCRELVENNRAIRRGKISPRRLLLIEPLIVNLTEGPAQVLLHSGPDQTRKVCQIEIPGFAVARFRRLLDLELASGLLTRHRARRSARLEAAFTALPAASDDPDWMESWILLNCLRRSRPSRTHAIIGQLRDHRVAQGAPNLFASFIQLVQETHGLALPNGHSFSASLDKLDRAQLWQGISDIMSLLKGMGLTVFLNSGTLLGAVREGDLLGHDDDIDLAVLVAGRSQEEAALAWMDLRRKLDDRGLVSETGKRNDTSIVKLPRIHGVQVDLFPAWIDGSGALFIYPHTHGELKRADLLPLKPGPQPGTRIPARAHRVLEQNYGPNWRVPDPLFRFPWDAANPHFRAFMTTLRAVTGDPADPAPATEPAP